MKTNHRKGSKSADAHEKSLRKRYPPRGDLAASISLSSPCIIIDMHGIILAWYLPGILTEARQVNIFHLLHLGSISNMFQGQMLAATQKLWQLLDCSVRNQSWCNQANSFQAGAELPTGVVNFSAVWFEQGHEVSCQMLLNSIRVRTQKPVQTSRILILLTGWNPSRNLIQF